MNTDPTGCSHEYDKIIAGCAIVLVIMLIVNGYTLSRIEKRVNAVPVKQQLERCQSCHTPDKLARHP
jgi:hypothetical protein